MRQYMHLRRKNRSVFFPVVALAMCVILSAAVLFSRLTDYSNQHIHQYIPLTVSNGVTKVTTRQTQLTRPKRPALTMLAAGAPAVRLNETLPTLQTSTQYLTTTDLEIFRLSYENGAGEITVRSAGEDKVIAPGTANAYTFSLQNTSDMGLDYQIEIDAYLTIDAGEKKLPIQLRICDYEGAYLLGGPDAFVSLSDVTVVSDGGSVSAGHMVPYTIEWQWPFEGDDELDTFLGNSSAENGNVSFVIEIRTVAQQGGEGGIPSTGDYGVKFAAVAMGVSAVGLVILVIPWKRKREDEDVPEK